MHNLHDVQSICSKKNLNLKHSCKLDVKNAKVELIDQHVNVTCHMWSLKMNFTLVPLAPKIVNTPIYYIKMRFELKSKPFAPWRCLAIYHSNVSRTSC
jgi:hypothetical protein